MTKAKIKKIKPKSVPVVAPKKNRKKTVLLGKPLDSVEAFGMREFTVYIPDNQYIKEGDYNMSGIVDLLRKAKKKPDIIQFIADMLE